MVLLKTIVFIQLLKETKLRIFFIKILSKVFKETKFKFKNRLQRRLKKRKQQFVWKKVLKS